MLIKKGLKSVLGLVAALGVTAHAADGAGSIEISGRGVVQALPDYMALEVPVVSLCYNTSKSAKDANALLANKLLTILKANVKVEGDEVLASGGANVRQTEYVEPEGSEKRKVLCDRKWRATNQLTLKTSSMGRLADFQDEILTAIGAAEEVNPAKVEQTYAQLGQPSFHLFAKSLLALRTQAQHKALDDAKAQLAVFTSRCNLSKVRLTSITPPSYYVGNKYAAASPESSDLGSRTPVIADKLAVVATWKFMWHFEPAETCNLF